MGMEHTTPHTEPKLGRPAVVHCTAMELGAVPVGLRGKLMDRSLGLGIKSVQKATATPRWCKE